MIEVSFSSYYMIYIIFLSFIVITMWFLNEARSKSGSLEIESENAFWQCQICAYTYVDSHSKDISICPRCGSYNKKNIEE
jgi:rubrerythrin